MRLGGIALGNMTGGWSLRTRVVEWGSGEPGKM